MTAVAERPLDYFEPTAELGELVEYSLNSTEPFDNDAEPISIYNPSVPFHNGRLQLARVQTTDANSHVALFDTLTRRQVGKATIPNMEDPFYIGQSDWQGEPYNIFGGVQIDTANGRVVNCRDLIYGCPIEQIHPLADTSGAEVKLEIIAVGPDGQKDLRPAPLPEGEWIGFPRPQNKDGFGGLGSIGVFKTAGLETLGRDLQLYYEREDPNTLLNLFKPGQWGAVGQVVSVSPNGLVHLGGHQAERVQRLGVEVRDYEGMQFLYNRFLGKVSLPEVIGRADDFPSVTPRQQEDPLGNIFFFAGLERTPNRAQTHRLHGGIGDAAMGVKPINRLTA